MRARMMRAGVLRDTQRLMGIMDESADAWAAVRGNPSRMKDAEGSGEGWGEVEVREGVLTKSSTEEEESSSAEEEAALESVSGGVDVEGNSQPRDLSSWRMRRRIMSSGTSLPDRMVDSARIPGGCLVSEDHIVTCSGRQTKRRPVLHIVPQQIPRADGGELREALEESFGLRALPDSWGADQDDARCFPEAHGFLCLSPSLYR